ncbi:polyprenyl synthetase family protein [Bacillus sp. FJAT-42376]|uniref:polyprenyl synthetase family protein n=1 Tax=Bacillus sp. FJAT-42376 TaxID=2014076 RepID=UPI000F501C26|nr:farnesyl diphosphate synthase [Bacillus sp. FJAT-42376]AZB44899.1 polyprenyl synthetase family protein [Bacillus sp. FJAT-42376]
MASRKALVERELPLYIEKLKAPESLKEAMLYSLNAGGKRLRPILILAALKAFGKEESLGLPAACAVEMIHTYSLIHDDLPCMDDDDLRRGKPTNHKVYGEALAVLAGDGLLTQSFQAVMSHETLSPEKKLRLISELVHAAGAEGMVGGQVADMEGEGKTLSLEDLEYIHMHKTAKLLTFSLVAGAILADAEEPEVEKIRAFGQHIGIAFQIRDDILDIEGTVDKIGKPVGSDTGNHKTTYPSLLAIDGAKDKLETHIALAKNVLADLGMHQTFLQDLTDLIALRES